MTNSVNNYERSYSYRGYHTAAWRYEVSLLVLFFVFSFLLLLLLLLLLLSSLSSISIAYNTHSTT